MSTFYRDVDGTLCRQTPTEDAVWWPKAGHWHPFKLDPFALTPITESQAKALAGTGADLHAPAR